MIGFHVSKGTRKMDVALKQDMEQLRSYGFKNICAQIFVSGPRDFHPMAEIEPVRVCIAGLGADVYIHGAYVDNPWGRAPASIRNIKYELEVSHHIGAKGVIIHLAAGAADDAILFDVLSDISSMPDEVKKSQVLYLEIHTAKSSAFTYETPQKIAALFARVAAMLDKIDNNVRLNVGLCIDSAHVFACGVAFAEYKFTKGWLDDVAAAVNVPILFHLNDSASTLGSGKDKHAPLLHGNIWGAYLLGTPLVDSGLYAILNWCGEKNVPMILERGDGLAGDLKLLAGVGLPGTQ